MSAATVTHNQGATGEPCSSVTPSTYWCFLGRHWIHDGAAPAVYRDRSVHCCCLPCSDVDPTISLWASIPCGGCGRTIYHLNTGRELVDPTCGEACYQRVRRRQARAARPLSVCARCGASFTARSDARWCSPRCRQAAYRARAAEATR